MAKKAGSKLPKPSPKKLGTGAKGSKLGTAAKSKLGTKGY